MPKDMFMSPSAWFSTYGFVLNNRELATLLWIAILVVFILFKQNTRSALVKVLKTASQPKLATVWTVYIAWILVFVILMDWVGFWRTELAKDTFVWMVTGGIAVLTQVTEATKAGYFRRAVLRVLSMVVILEYLINLTSFSLWVEFFVMQPVVTGVYIAPIVTEDPEQQKTWRRIRGYFSIILVTTLLTHTAQSLNESLETLDMGFIALRAIWPMLLGIWVLMLVFGLALIFTYEQAFLNLESSRGEGKELWKVKLGLILALRHRLRYIREAAKVGSINVARADSVSEAYYAAKGFKKELEESD
jgi:hypothetical protein